jgi:hypothetical protein
MPSSEWTGMAVAAGAAVIAMSFLAIDAVVDVSPGGIARRLEVAQTSIMDVAASQYQLSPFGRWRVAATSSLVRPRIDHASTVTSTGRNRYASIAAFDSSSLRRSPRDIMRSILFMMKRAES